MTSYIALLRGINVSGKNPVPMADLKKSLADFRLGRLKTYVQSGNLAFEAPASENESTLTKKIGSRILRDFGVSVPVLVRTAKELEKLVAANPFLKERGIDPKTLHVTFLADAPAKTVLKNLERLPLKPDRFIVKGRAIYLHCPKGYGKTKLSNAAFERLLTITATTRNWKTCNSLLKMAGG